MQRRYALDIDKNLMGRIIQIIKEILLDDECYPRKFRKSNYFKKPSPELNLILRNLLLQTGELGELQWYFEVFYSIEPVGLHNDRNYFPTTNEICEKGLLLPISWSGQHAGTRFYDLFIEQKVNWAGDSFRTLDGRLIDHNPDKLLNPMNISWSPFEALFFDSRQIHEALPFDIGANSHKLSINGLGYKKRHNL
jgi:hypothetical protein